MQYKFLAAGAALMFSSFLSAQTLVSLDGVSISADELEQAMKTLVPENQQESLTMKEQNVRSFMLDILTYKRMAAEAEKYKLDQQPATRAKLDFERNKILTTALIDDYINKAKEPNLEALARELYLTNKSEYKSPEQVQARHILIAVNDERSDEQALKLATELATKAKKLAKAGKGEEFVGLALEHSDDPSAERNGGVGVMPAGMHHA
ncbi:MAG: peptidylprolyl isomerase, partial [Thiopseudomonas sp.]